MISYCLFKMVTRTGEKLAYVNRRISMKCSLKTDKIATDFFCFCS